MPDDNSDPDEQFIKDSDNFCDTPYFSPNDANNFFKQKHICAHNSLVVTKKENLSMNCVDLETLVIEIENVKDKSVIVDLVYRPPK